MSVQVYRSPNYKTFAYHTQGRDPYFMHSMGVRRHWQEVVAIVWNDRSTDSRQFVLRGWYLASLLKWWLFEKLDYLNVENMDWPFVNVLEHKLGFQHHLTKIDLAPPRPEEGVVAQNRLETVFVCFLLVERRPIHVFTNHHNPSCQIAII